MSWSKRRAGAMALAMATAGCGFHPLYGSQTLAVPAGLEKTLATIRVARVADRQGQILTNQLTDALNPHGLSIAADYRLDVRLQVNTQNYDIRSDSTTGRSETTVTAMWALVRLSDSVPELSGTSKALTGHDVLIQEYNNVSSSLSDRDHALAEVAEDIETRLVLHFQDQNRS